MSALGGKLTLANRANRQDGLAAISPLFERRREPACLGSAELHGHVLATRAMHEMQQFAVQHPDQTTVTSGPGQYSISVRGNHPEFMSGRSVALYLAVTFGLAILLYAAAVVRRLRDRGKSGFWGLMPLPFILYSSIQMPRLQPMIISLRQ